MEEKLLAFIKDEFLEDPEMELTAETKLISSGLIDSFSLVSLHQFIKKEFCKNIPPPKITTDTFDSVRQMIEIINQY